MRRRWGRDGQTDKSKTVSCLPQRMEHFYVLGIKKEDILAGTTHIHDGTGTD